MLRNIFDIAVLILAFLNYLKIFDRIALHTELYAAVILELCMSCWTNQAKKWHSSQPVAPQIQTGSSFDKQQIVDIDYSRYWKCSLLLSGECSGVVPFSLSLDVDRESECWIFTEGKLDVIGAMLDCASDNNRVFAASAVISILFVIC